MKGVVQADLLQFDCWDVGEEEGVGLELTRVG